jgi:hypothetical protein
MLMRRTVFAMVPLLVFGPALWGVDDPQDKSKDDKKPTPAEQYKALTAEVQKAQQEIVKAYGQAKTEEDKQTILDNYYKKPQEYTGRFLELAKRNPKDKMAFDALSYVVTNGGEGPETTEAVNLLLKDHADKLGALAQRLRNAQGAAGPIFLRAVLEKSSDHAVQGQAGFSLGQYLKRQADSPKLKPAEADKLNKEAESLLVKVTEKYADVGKLADQAKTELFEIRNLAIGKKAPEIEGEDIDGQKFKLTDYQGKVVVLDFWGHW